MKFNSSSIGKIKEYASLFGEDISATHLDLPEIKSNNPLEVMAHKVSLVPSNVFVDDTSLFIEGEIGTEIRWFFSKIPEYIGKRAQYIVLLAYHDDKNVYIYKGETWGTIVEDDKDSHPEIQIDKYFVPDGSNVTLDKILDKSIKPRAKVVNNFLTGNLFSTLKLPEKWQGEWQG